MVEEHRNVRVAFAVELLELRLHPGELNRVVGNVRIEGNEEPAPVPEAVGRIALEPMWRSLARDQSRVRREIILQAGRTFRVRRVAAVAHVMIADGQEI